MIFIAIIGLIVALGVTFLRDYFLWTQESRRVQRASKDIVQSALDKESFLIEQVKFDIQEKDNQLRKNSQDFFRDVRYKIRQIQNNINKSQHKNRVYAQDIKKKIKTQKQKLISIQEKVDKDLKKFQTIFDEYAQVHKQYLDKAQKNFSFDVSLIKKDIKDQVLGDLKVQMKHFTQKIEENTQKDSEKNAIQIIDRVLARFPKPYCPERGIGIVNISNKSIFGKIIGSERKLLNFLEKKCGVDVIADEEQLSFSIQGLDPVRREWGRLTLSKLSRKKGLNEGIVSSVIRLAKRELFKKIRRDGKKICNILNLKNVAIEVSDMMGALRYRYSFAQNQYFHCEEVGWLCGLLNFELGEGNIYRARRSGLFHDIGKAMDHAHSGGHAMIGADFIEKYGEEERVVRAVRAHHHDVRPEYYLDFLVIAADAISGSRPGARRSTVDSYNQKVLSLERIGKEFEGVRDLYVMNAGREVRVIVNSQEVSDEEALELSKKMVQRIEEECSYPGWIKVTVVRKVETYRTTQLAQ